MIDEVRDPFAAGLIGVLSLRRCFALTSIEGR
jgi:hypothetical protein